MRNRILATLSTVLIAGGFVVVSAQQTTRIKRATDPTPSWTYKGQWYGFVTCSRLIQQRNRATVDEIKKCVADGGVYILASGGRLDLTPPEKAAQYAGQQVLLTGTMTSTRYGTGPTSDASIEGLYAGGDRPATRFQTITVLSAEIMPPEPMRAPAAADDLGSRVSPAAQ